MPLPFEGVAQAIRRGQVAPAYVLAGPDGLQQAEVLAALRSRVPELGQQRLAGEEVTPKDVVGALRTVSFVPGRLVVVEDAPWIAAPKRGGDGGDGEDREGAGDGEGVEAPPARPSSPPASLPPSSSPPSPASKRGRPSKAGVDQPLLDYLERPATGAILVLRQQAPADRRRRLVKRIADCGVLLETVAPRDNTPWMREEMRRQGLVMPGGLLPLLGARLRGADCTRVRSELHKLADHGPGLDARALDALIPAAEEERIYDLVDAAIAGEGARAFQLAEALRAQGEPVPRLLYSLASQLLTLVRVGAACRGGARLDAVSGELGLHPFVARKALEQSRAVSAAAAAAALQALWEAEFGFKTGRLGDSAALERALAGILIALHRGRGAAPSA